MGDGAADTLLEVLTTGWVVVAGLDSQQPIPENTALKLKVEEDSLTVSMPSSLSHLTALAVFYLRGRGVWGPLPGSVTTLTNLWCVARLLLLRHLRVSLLVYLVYMSMAGWVGEKA
jgi:hypothetical protein